MSLKRCSFVALGCAALLLTGCGSVDGEVGSASNVVEGEVLGSPTCPVERAGSDCAPAPVEGAEVQLLRGTEVVDTTRTDAAGHFQLTAPEGDFLVHATNAGGYPSEVSQPVTVSPGSVTTVKLVLDSGIR